MAQVKLSELSARMLSNGSRVLSLIALPVALLALPTNALAQGNCKQCAQGTYYDCNPYGCAEYPDATFCADGALWGWIYCADDPPYGPCAVSGAPCGDDDGDPALTSIPGGLIGSSAEIHFASFLSCSAERNAGAVVRTVWIDTGTMDLADARIRDLVMESLGAL